MSNETIAPANTNEYQHYLCEIIIKYLYGEDADVERYKVYHGTEKNFDRLRGVDISQFDYTTKKHIPKCQVAYDDKVSDALQHAKFGRKYGDLHMHDEGDSLFKATIDSSVYPNARLQKSVLSIYQK